MKSQKADYINRLIHFIKYNNAFVLIIVFIFASFSLTMAASPDARKSVYSSKETVRSVDNGYLLALNLDAFNFALQIKNIEEDQENFYVYYGYNTVSIDDYVWKPVYRDKRFIVSKESLGSQDLGLYLANELGQEISYQYSSLSDAKRFEQEKGLSLKTSTVEYGGLIGKMLDPEEKIFPEYTPVKLPIIEEEETASPDQNENLETEQILETTSSEIQNPIVIFEERVTVDENLIRATVERILAEKKIQEENNSSSAPNQSVIEVTPTPTPLPVQEKEVVVEKKEEILEVNSEVVVTEEIKEIKSESTSPTTTVETVGE